MRTSATTQFQSFMRQVDASLLAGNGVRYSEIQNYVEAAAGSPKAMDAMRDGMAPADFSASVGLRLGLVGVDASGPDAAGEVNKRVAALAEMVGEDASWSLGNDGAAYRMDESGVSRIAPGRDGTQTTWGFVAFHSAEGHLDAGSPDRAVPVGTEFSRVGGGLDMSDALGRLDAHLSNAPSAPRLG